MKMIARILAALLALASPALAQTGQFPANTFWGNATGATGQARTTALPSCSAANSAIIYTSSTGFGCRTNVPGLDLANIFTAAQIISITAAGDALTVSTNEAGASYGPGLNLYRNSASATTSDALGRLTLSGNDTAGTQKIYGLMQANIIDATIGNEDGAVSIWPIVAGAVTQRLTVGPEVSLPSTTVSTSSTTGALIVSGGAGFAGAIFGGSTIRNDASNSGTVNIGAITTALTRTTSVGTGGIFSGVSASLTDTGSTASLADQVIRATLTFAASASPSAGASMITTAPFINESLSGLYGIEIAAPTVASTKTLGQYTGVDISAPGGAGTTTTTTAINIRSGAGPIQQNGGQFVGTGSSVSYTPFVGTSTEAAAAIGPYAELYRNSASAIAADNLGSLLFTGNSDNGTKRSYAEMYGNIIAATNGTETGAMYWNVRGAGTNAIEMILSRGLSLGNVSTLGVVGSLHVGATTASTSISTGALVVDGGAGFAGNIFGSGTANFQTATVIPAGGTTGAGYKFSSTANFGIFFGSGVPTLSAAQGSLYLRSDGAINARLYINTNGTTGWTAFNTAS